MCFGSSLKGQSFEDQGLEKPTIRKAKGSGAYDAAATTASPAAGGGVSRAGRNKGNRHGYGIFLGTSGGGGGDGTAAAGGGF